MDFSTSEVFGSHVYMAEEHNATALGVVGESRWTYAVSKLAAEHLVSSYHKEHGLETVTIRPFNVYGPQQVGVGAIHTFVVDALQGKDLVIHGDGNQIQILVLRRRYGRRRAAVPGEGRGGGARLQHRQSRARRSRWPIWRSSCAGSAVRSRE